MRPHALSRRILPPCRRHNNHIIISSSSSSTHLNKRCCSQYDPKYNEIHRHATRWYSAAASASCPLHRHATHNWCNSSSIESRRLHTNNNNNTVPKSHQKMSHKYIRNVITEFLLERNLVLHPVVGEASPAAAAGTQNQGLPNSHRSNPNDEASTAKGKSPPSQDDSITLRQYTSHSDLSPLEWNQLSNLTGGLSHTALKRLVWNHTQNYGKITTRVRERVLHVLRENDWERLHSSQLDSLQEELNIGRLKLHGLVERLRATHGTAQTSDSNGPSLNLKDARLHCRQLLKECFPSLSLHRRRLTKEDIHQLHLKTGLNKFQIYQELRRFRESPGDMTLEKKERIWEWYWQQSIGGGNSSTATTPAPRAARRKYEELSQELFLSPEQIRLHIKYIREHFLPPGSKRQQIHQWCNEYFGVYGLRHSDDAVRDVPADSKLKEVAHEYHVNSRALQHYLKTYRKCLTRALQMRQQESNGDSLSHEVAAFMEETNAGKMHGGDSANMQSASGTLQA